MKTRLLVSVSGGKSSMYMAKQLWDKRRDTFDMVFVFANTGEEWEETLLFTDRCAREWGIDIVWVEAVTHPGQRIGCTHQVVTFETASRRGEPFQGVIEKYGIPNKKYPHCTRELKLNPIRSYMLSIGWEYYLSAVGIRIDEPARLRGNAEECGIIYPLFDMFPMEKADINEWWAAQPFNLNLLERQGNCKACWKKTLTKLLAIAQETPEAFEFSARMESTFGTYADGARRVFFRENRSAVDLLAMSKVIDPATIKNRPDENSGCSESCEAFA